MTEYAGRRRRDPQCQYQYEGCLGEGTEILDPLARELDNEERVVVACFNCEGELNASL